MRLEQLISEFGPETPNFFLVGAPKAGTTSMHDWLDQHPAIYMSEWKETKYFLTDLEHNNRVPSQKYRELFRGRSGSLVRGESTTWYLLSKDAARNIQAFNLDAKIFIMLRNPIDLMWSLHGYLLSTGQEDILDFERALKMEANRAGGKDIPKTTVFPSGLLYRQVVDFLPQIQRYFEVFPRNQIHIELFDDLVSDPEAVYRRVLGFLNVDDEFRPRFEAKNVRRPLPNLKLRRLMHRAPALSSVLHTCLPDAVLDCARSLIGVATQKPRPPMSVDFRQKLQAEFTPKIEELGDFLGVDLSRWTNR